MVSENPNLTSLLPVRHPQQDLFICDIADCVLKNDIASMEHPVFSLSKKPDLSVREYVNGDKRLTVTPSVKGMATIYDKDILIFAISQLMRNIEPPLGTHVHQLQRFSPPRNDTVNWEFRRFATFVGAVEHSAINKRTVIVSAYC